MPLPHRRLQTLDRRALLRGAGFLAAGTALGLPVLPARAQAPSAAAPVTFDIKPLPFDPKQVPGLSEKLLVSHHENNYAGAVKRLNAITAQLATLDWASAPVFQINGLKREELIAMNSMILHEVYFDGIGGGGDPSGALAEAIRRDFGSLERWRAAFAAIGKAQGGGSGWTILAWSPHDRRLVNAWAADHTTNLAGGRPILVMDMYEHAYHMDYGARAAAYVDAFLKVIRWDGAAKRFDQFSREA